MKFDSKEQQKLVLDIVSNAQVTTSISNLQKASAEMSALVKAIVDAEVEKAPNA